MMDKVAGYISRNPSPPGLFFRPATHKPSLIVVIPAAAEPELEETLKSLYSNVPAFYWECIIVANCSEELSGTSRLVHNLMIQGVNSFKHKHNLSNLHIIEVTFPAATAGVGAARKTGMDAALDRLYSAGNPEGVIVCLDADCRVNAEYLNSISDSFSSGKVMAGVCGFQHIPMDDAILEYELFIRYYRHAVRWTGHPHHAYTIGSCMAVRASAYALQGGMNKRKAAEDFHFLLKFMKAYGVDDIPGAMVFPSSRISDRVPFGTGKAMQKLRGGEAQQFYPFSCFVLLRDFIQLVPAAYNQQINPGVLNPHLAEFLEREGIGSQLLRCRQNSAGQASFIKNFFRWFNALKMLRAVHFLTERLENEPAPWEELLCSMGYEVSAKSDALAIFRKEDNVATAVNQQLVSYSAGQ